jgi:6-pyruvoyltetrahydropterin/6-carboxytetrahydropterin synthase
MHRITRRLHFCYGHRLLEYQGKCAHPHGHNGVLEVEIASERLDGRGMVCDFGEVKELLMSFIDQELDHRMILRKGDPLIDALRSVGESPFILEDNPTAENIARLIYRRARDLGLPVTAVRFWETENCHAEYSE